MTTPILAYDGSDAFKAEIVARMQRDAETETLVPGHYWETNGKPTGCWIGCIIHSDSHADAMTKIGAPPALGHLGDEVFEGLCRSDLAAGRAFGVELLEAMPAGADLGKVPDRAVVWLLQRLLTLAAVEQDAASLTAVDRVLGLYRRRLAGDEPSREDWQGAARGASRATADATADAACAAACATAYATADAAYATADAAYAAADAARVAAAVYAACAAANAAAYDDFWRDLAAEVIRLCKEAPTIFLAKNQSSV